MLLEKQSKERNEEEEREKRGERRREIGGINGKKINVWKRKWSRERNGKEAEAHKACPLFARCATTIKLAPYHS